MRSVIRKSRKNTSGVDALAAGSSLAYASGYNRQQPIVRYRQALAIDAHSTTEPRALQGINLIAVQVR